MKKQRAVDYFFSQLTVVPVIEKYEMKGIFISLENYHDILETAEAMEREQIKAALPSKDDAVNVGFRKAINADYNLRKVCKDSDDDLYYSGWMDCYDWLNQTYKGGEQ
jgi:hypothetical protein